jgi:hypothetical protein
MVTSIHDIVVFFADFVTYGTAVVTASVIFMGLLKVTVTRGIVATFADLILAQNCHPNAGSSPGLASNHSLLTNKACNLHATMCYSTAELVLLITNVTSITVHYYRHAPLYGLFTRPVL